MVLEEVGTEIELLEVYPGAPAVLEAPEEHIDCKQVECSVVA